MDLFATLAPAPPGVGARCARKRLRRSRCDRCITRCPTGALALHDGVITLARDRCTGCGICLFACPADALEHLAPLTRFYRDGVLFGPFTLPVAVEELLLWHAHYAIRAIAVDLTHDTHWLRPLAELNLLLRQRGEPGWQCMVPPATPGEMKRRLLAMPRGRVPHDVTSRRAAGAYALSFGVTLDAGRCLLCGACGHICPEGVIRFNEGTLTLDPSRCHGCGDCAAVCPVDAVSVAAGETFSVTRLRFTTARCVSCGEPWRAWAASETRCPLCRRHGFGMRGG
ncbi:polyferredoxin [Cronobacter condimenti 1330]|nr:4Fe-4S binding protein [Cronobacter condimenti]ALB62687.1 polyferredoxin [Cronobacter condimenti 1330]